MPSKFLQLQLLIQANLGDTASKTCSVKGTGEQGRDVRQHSASPSHVPFNDGWENCSDLSSWGLSCDVTPSPLTSHISFWARMSRRKMWLMQPDTPCHHARSASWETERKGRKKKKEKQENRRGGGEQPQASEKVFLGVVMFRGVVLFLRKAVLPAKAKNKDKEQKKNPDWGQISDQIVYWRSTRGLGRPSIVKGGT